jgi:hypothetical protein
MKPSAWQKIAVQILPDSQCGLLLTLLGFSNIEFFTGPSDRFGVIIQRITSAQNHPARGHLLYTFQSLGTSSTSTAARARCRFFFATFDAFFSPNGVRAYRTGQNLIPQLERSNFQILSPDGLPDACGVFKRSSLRQLLHPPTSFDHAGLNGYWAVIRW